MERGVLMIVELECPNCGVDNMAEKGRDTYCLLCEAELKWYRGVAIWEDKEEDML